MTLNKINEDLVRERQKCSFDVQELIHLIDYGEKNTKERKKIGEFYFIIATRPASRGCNSL